MCVPVKRISGHFVARDFPTKRLSENDKALSETTSACQKQQTLVGNNKRLSETTNACQKRQSFVGKFILS
jgi:hypothetical protein